MPTRAIIFDLDDTLVATAALWQHAETRLLRTIGQAWRPEVAAMHKGMNALDVAAVIHRHYQPAISLSEARQVMRDALLEQFKIASLTAMPGAAACIARAAKRGPIAVASGSPADAIAGALTRLNMFHAFSVVVSSETVSRGKPFPDVYLQAAKALAPAQQTAKPSRIAQSAHKQLIRPA